MQTTRRGYIFHVLLYCPLLTDTRLNSFKVLRDFVKYYIGDETWKNSFSTKDDIVQLIIDNIKFSHLFDNTDIILEIEKHSINMCYKLYLCPMKTHHSSDAHRRDLSKAVQNCAIYIYYLGQMQCFRTKLSISVTISPQF